MHTRLIPLEKWKDYHPWPTSGGLRNLIYQKDKPLTKSFEKVYKRCGNKILIDEQAFFDWVEEQDKLSKGEL
jgi:hypothetical protein